MKTLKPESIWNQGTKSRTETLDTVGKRESGIKQRKTGSGGAGMVKYSGFCLKAH